MEIDHRLVDAGIAAAPLIADPKSWINRRVETIELLSREETRRQVSVDFTLSDEQMTSLRIADGIVVPISVLAKERRRAFDLRDEGGNAVPVLGKAQNGELSLVALWNAAAAALPGDLPDDELGEIAADLRGIVFEPASTAHHVRADFERKAAVPGSWHGVINADPTCRSLLDVMWTNYVLFAVLATTTPCRRILKYAYGDDINLASRAGHDEREARASDAAYRLRFPDRRWFAVECPGAWRARSFHAEVVIPEELRFDTALLYDRAHLESVSPPEVKVNRAALYPSKEIRDRDEIVAALEVSPEGEGRIDQASATSVLVTLLLWLGVASGLDAGDPDAAVSILLGGAALYSGVTAVHGEHRLVSAIFSATRRWLLVVTTAALLASASLAMGFPDASPIVAWSVASAVSTVAASRLMWSSVRARA